LDYKNQQQITLKLNGIKNKKILAMKSNAHFQKVGALTEQSLADTHTHADK
jgi:hypothetical protein